MRFLVVDSGPLIKGIRLERIDAERFVTVPEVLSEIRDKQTRALLETLPVELETREPSDEAMIAVSQFARQTGDLPVLSTVDLRVLALTWMLEKECHGGVAHLRTTPPSRAAPKAATSEEAPGATNAPTTEASAATNGSMPGWPDDDGGALDEAAFAAAAEEGEAAAVASLSLADDGEQEDEGDGEVEEVLDDVPQRVLQGLYLGSVDAAQNLPALRARGITHVLTVAKELSQEWPAEFAHKYVAVQDSETVENDLLSQFAPCNAFIDGARAAGGGVLVHCLAGRSRSAAVCAAYLMHAAEAAGADAALRHVREARPWVEPNAAFVAQLRSYEEQLVAAAKMAKAATKEDNPVLALVDAVGKGFADFFSGFGKKPPPVPAVVGTAGTSGGDSAPAAAEEEEAAATGAPQPTKTAFSWASVAAAPAAAAPPPPKSSSSAAASVAASAPPPPSQPAAAVEAAPTQPEDVPAAAAKEGAWPSAPQQGDGGGGGGGSGGATTTRPDELDDDLPWITVENLKEKQATEESSKFSYAPDASVLVSCVTTDYAMQSVLMQMNMRLLGVDGMVMKSVKQWVLRCSGCFTVHREMGRQFCLKCGNTSLVRLIAIVDAQGQTRVLPERGAPARVRSTNTRGTKFAMPMPQAGRAGAQNLILAEDQHLEAVEKKRRQGRKKGVDVFDADYDNDSHFGRAGKKGQAYGINTTVGVGKRNPNDVRTRSKKR